MKRNKKLIGCILIIMLTFSVIFVCSFVNNKNVNNNAKEKYVDLNNDGQKEKVLLDGNKIKVDNSNGKNVFNSIVDSNSKNVNIGFIEDKQQNDIKIITFSKTDDTSRMLTLKSYSYKDNKVSENILMNDVYQGKAEIKDNNLIVSTPVFEKNDSNAQPSYQQTTTYELSDNKLSVVNTEKSQYKLNAETASASYYKNPSYDEINKIIDYVANEKGIPPEILKAVAWQESRGTDRDNGSTANWRQFVNGQPLIGYDHIGIGIMQVSDYNASDTAYVNRLKYDVEFNIREGADILLEKWNSQFSTSGIPKVGDGSPLVREHWYYALWAYNGYCQKNNPALYHDTAYQTLVIGHVNNVFKKTMVDLYEYNSSLFGKDLPFNNIAEVTCKNYTQINDKRKNFKYIVDDNVSIMDSSSGGSNIGSFSKNDIVNIDDGPVCYNGHLRYHVSGEGKSGWVSGTVLHLLGDTNYDNVIDIYDYVNIRRHIDKNNPGVTNDNISEKGKYDINGDGSVDDNDVNTIANSGNWH